MEGLCLPDCGLMHGLHLQLETGVLPGTDVLPGRQLVTGLCMSVACLASSEVG